MRTLKNTFGNKQTMKSLNNFSETLDINTMILIKGGEGDPIDDLWPPIDDEEETT